MAFDRQLAQVVECRRGAAGRRLAGAHDASQGADDLDVQELGGMQVAGVAGE